ERPREREGKLDQGQEDPVPDDRVRRGARDERGVGALYRLRQKAEADARRRAPGDGEREHAQRLVLVQVDGDEVEDDEEWDEHRRDDEREWVDAGERERRQQRDARRELGPERGHPRPGQVRKEGRDDPRLEPVLGGRGGEAAPPRRMERVVDCAVRGEAGAAANAVRTRRNRRSAAGAGDRLGHWTATL